jgi:hypothetical protein
LPAVCPQLAGCCWLQEAKQDHGYYFLDLRSHANSPLPPDSQLPDSVLSQPDPSRRQSVWRSYAGGVPPTAQVKATPAEMLAIVGAHSTEAAVEKLRGQSDNELRMLHDQVCGAAQADPPCRCRFSPVLTWHACPSLLCSQALGHASQVSGYRLRKSLLRALGVDRELLRATTLSILPRGEQFIV